MNTPIYIITLDRESSRCRSCLEALGQAGVPDSLINFFAAKTYQDVDPRMLLDDAKDGVRVRLAYGRKLRISGQMVPNEIGCSYSHLCLYRKALDQGYEKILILEDDAVVPSDFLDRFRLCCDLNDSDFDVINFGCGVGVRTPVYPFCKLIRFKDRSFYLRRIGWGSRFIDSLFSRRRMVFSTHAYLITSRGCRKLLELSSTDLFTGERYGELKIQLPADYLLGYLALNGLQTYGFDSGAYVTTCDSGSQIGTRNPHKFLNL